MSSIEYEVDAHAGPRLGDTAPVESGPAQVAQFPGAPVVIGWTPEEIESQLMGIWFFGWVAVCMVRWKRPEFAVNFAAQPGEFRLSATALVPVFDQYMPKSIGGPGGVVFALPVVANELVAAVMRRGPLLAQGPPDAAQPATERRPSPNATPPAPSAPSPESGSFKIPSDLVPPPHGYDGIGPTL